MATSPNMGGALERMTDAFGKFAMRDEDVVVAPQLLRKALAVVFLRKIRSGKQSSRVAYGFIMKRQAGDQFLRKQSAASGWSLPVGVTMTRGQISWETDAINADVFLIITVQSVLEEFEKSGKLEFNEDVRPVKPAVVVENDADVLAHLDENFDELDAVNIGKDTFAAALCEGIFFPVWVSNDAVVKFQPALNAKYYGIKQIGLSTIFNRNHPHLMLKREEVQRASKQLNAYFNLTKRFDTTTGRYQRTDSMVPLRMSRAASFETERLGSFSTAFSEDDEDRSSTIVERDLDDAEDDVSDDTPPPGSDD